MSCVTARAQMLRDFARVGDFSIAAEKHIGDDAEDGVDDERYQRSDDEQRHEA
jgi:hypothetical protein